MRKRVIENTNKVFLLRTRTGLTQTEFAEKMHISPRTLQGWESGRRTVPDHIYYLMERVLTLEEEVIRLKRRKRKGEAYGTVNKEKTRAAESRIHRTTQINGESEH